MIPLGSAIVFNILTGAACFLVGLFTRAAVQAVRERREGKRVWLQNETLKNVEYWRERHELPDHIYRKAHQARRYDVTRVEIGMPKAARAGDSQELFSQGLVGVYGYRREA
jgi:hypothetical protein